MIPEPTVGGGGAGSCCVRSNCREEEEEEEEEDDRLFIHTSCCYITFRPHQLRLAPGDAVAGDGAEVASSGDFDSGPGCALLLMLRHQNPQETV